MRGTFSPSPFGILMGGTRLCWHILVSSCESCHVGVSAHNPAPVWFCQTMISGVLAWIDRYLLLRDLHRQTYNYLGNLKWEKGWETLWWKDWEKETETGKEGKKREDWTSGLTLFSVISGEKNHSDITKLMSCSLFHQQHPGCASHVSSINLSWRGRERKRKGKWRESNHQEEKKKT